MNRSFRFVVLGMLLSGGLAGCSLSSDRISVARYTLVVMPETRQDWYGNGCDSSRGEMMVVDGDLSGQITDSWGDSYALSGNRNDSGQLESGLAYSHRNSLMLSGELIERGGDGQWQDRLGCTGHWAAAPLQ